MIMMLVNGLQGCLCPQGCKPGSWFGGTAAAALGLVEAAARNAAQLAVPIWTLTMYHVHVF